jgi:acyl-CoA synthetase (AMP-forming)/AMP-acid ligase II
MTMHRYQSLGEMLQAAAREAGGRAGYRFVDTGEAPLVSFDELANAASRAATCLQAKGLGKGDRVILILPTSRDFAVAFFAVTLCGAVPCVLAPPAAGIAADGVDRVQKIAEQIRAQRLIARDENLTAWLPSLPGVQGCSVEELVAGPEQAWTPVEVLSTDLAYVQATSGSTGLPKCVALTHSSVLANLEQIGRALRSSEEDIAVSWLPLFHDMGLIGCFLMTVYWRFTTVLMSPMRFLRNPLSFLKAITTYRGTSAANPTFAYALLTSRVREADLAALDLSSWKRALCGSEPVSLETLERFAERFRPCGFSPNSFVPCYGLAEATLAVTMHPVGEPLRAEWLDRTALAGNLAELGKTGDESRAVRVVDCGFPVEGAQVEIRAEAGDVLPEGHVGQVWAASPSLAQGYYGATSTPLLNDGWLNTGDLGYLRGGRLFVTGRHKDLVIIRGQKYLPMDFEAAATAATSSRVVAFGIEQGTDGTEGLCILCEAPREAGLDLEKLRADVERKVSTTTGIIPACIQFVPRNSIPHTTSGKLQRSKARQMFLAGALTEAGTAE